MNKAKPSHVMYQLEREYISHITNQSIADLAAVLAYRIDTMNDMYDLISMLYDKQIKYLFNNEEFLNLPIIAHYKYKDFDKFFIETHDSIGEIDCYNTISINSANKECRVCFSTTPDFEEVTDSDYKFVRDLLPLIEECVYDMD